MKGTTAKANGRNGQRRQTALEGLLKALPTHGWPAIDEPMDDISEVIELSEEQARQFEKTGSVALQMRTVGPTAKQRERQRLCAGGRPRTRARGAGRPKAHATRSSARSGDSGDDSESSEPPERRLCICPCGRDISHKRAGALYFNPEACRKRYKRELDRADPDRVVERKLKRLAIAESLDRVVAEDLPRGCRCSSEGVYRDPEGAWVCRACGRPLVVAITTRNGYDARMAELQKLMRNDRAEVRVVHRHRGSREWRTRPTRSMAAKLRHTRVDRKVAQ